MLRVNRQFFVVKIDKKLQEQKRSHMVKKHIGFLGIKYSKQDGDDKINGVRVWDIEKDSPAYDAGFSHGDTITAINSIKVVNYEEMSNEVSKYAPNDTITIHYLNRFSKDGKEQLKKTVKLAERKFEIVLPPSQVDFQANLQFGEILEIGTIAKEQFPEAKIGDVLLFKHTVEHKPRGDNDNLYHDYHLIDVDEDTGDEIRIVNFTNEVYGVIKPEEGNIIPYHKYIFCHYNIKKATIQHSKSGLWLPDQWVQTKEDIQAKLDKLKEDIASITSSTVMKQRTTDKNHKNKDVIRQVVNSINAERKALTRKMSQKKYVEVMVLFIHPETNEELQSDIKVGDTILTEYDILYPLDLMGNHYSLVHRDYVEGIINKN